MLQLSAEQREAYLKAACGGDVTLLERIRDLIWFHEKGDGPLEPVRSKYSSEAKGAALG